MTAEDGAFEDLADLDRLACLILPHLNARQERAKKTGKKRHEIRQQMVCLEGIVHYLYYLELHDQGEGDGARMSRVSEGYRYGLMLIGRAREHQTTKIQSIGRRKQ